MRFRGLKYRTLLGHILGVSSNGVADSVSRQKLGISLYLYLEALCLFYILGFIRGSSPKYAISNHATLSQTVITVTGLFKLLK
jgi:hypothetical protein